LQITTDPFSPRSFRSRSPRAGWACVRRKGVSAGAEQLRPSSKDCRAESHNGTIEAVFPTLSKGASAILRQAGWKSMKGPNTTAKPGFRAGSWLGAKIRPFGRRSKSCGPSNLRRKQYEDLHRPGKELAEFEPEGSANGKTVRADSRATPPQVSSRAA